MTRIYAPVDAIQQQLSSGGQEVLDRTRDAAGSAWVERLARLGLFAKGVLYATIGGLAVQAASGRGGETTDSHGALQNIATQPFGKVMLGVLALGLVGYALWCFVRAVYDVDHKGKDAKGLGARAGYFGSGVLHVGLALAALRLLTGSGSGGGGGAGSPQNVTAELLSKPFGQWLVALVGAGIIGFGLYQLWTAYKARFLERFRLGEMSPSREVWAKRIGRIGYAARGIVFSMIGIFFIQAAMHSNPGEAKGLDGALQTLAEQSHGPWLLGIVALGLVAYGLYCFVEALYRRIGKPSPTATWNSPDEYNRRKAA